MQFKSSLIAHTALCEVLDNKEDVSAIKDVNNGDVTENHLLKKVKGEYKVEYKVLSHGYVIFLLFFSIEHIPMSVMNASFMSHTYLCNME